MFLRDTKKMLIDTLNENTALSKRIKELEKARVRKFTVPDYIIDELLEDDEDKLL